jgi:hypothetical protein
MENKKYTREEQEAKIDELRLQGYIWNKHKSGASAGVVLEKGDDLWYFSLDGDIMHNPESLTIQV